MRFILWSLLMMILADGSPAAIAPERKSDICLTFARNWQGTHEELRRIAVEPIPQSYRRQYGWTWCEHLMKGSLIDWHLAFGDERSTTEALRFLATTALEGMPSVRDAETALPAVWRKAQAAVQHRPISPEASGPARYRQIEALRRDRAVRQLQMLIVAHDRFAFLAEQYLRAAEFFRSRALLEEASRYLTPLTNAEARFYEGVRVAKAADGSILQYAVGIEARGVNLLHDLQMRYALTTARISGSAADLAAAAAVIEENDDAVMRAAIQPLLGDDGTFCETDVASEILAAACKGENDLPGRIRAFWRSKAQIELAEDVRPAARNLSFSAFDVAWHAIDAAARPAFPESVHYNSATDDHVVLLLARAEAQFRRSQAPNIPAEDATSLRREALGDLFRAERLTPPALNPNRFRQIAERYLSILQSEPQARQRGMDEEMRQAAYLRQVLAGLANPPRALPAPQSPALMP
ncbi:hypothetical protein AB2M62_16415 [Sphingomonas sp. MMS12-HWE2-04]|uniref:hypothetical protein n=1 Tax=Sphingomonas sp. MMS12-HWE2-04 TaxID=3234199 RepID=UPI00384DA151